MILDALLPATASTYAGDIDRLFDTITLLVMLPFSVACYLFFSFIFRFKAKDGVKAMYITGTEHRYMKWIHRAHIPVLTFDLIIVVMAVPLLRARADTDGQHGGGRSGSACPCPRRIQQDLSPLVCMRRDLPTHPGRKVLLFGSLAYLPERAPCGLVFHAVPRDAEKRHLRGRANRLQSLCAPHAYRHCLRPCRNRPQG